MMKIGLLLILLGFLIRLVSIRQMGNFSLAVNYSDEIKMSGVYKYIRHPAYVGSLIVFIGLILVSLHLAILYLVFIFYLSRAIQEESILMNNPSYKEYYDRTGRFFPKLKGVLNGTGI